MKTVFLTTAAFASLTFGGFAFADGDVSTSQIVESTESTTAQVRFTSLYGDIDAFYGDIDAFYGDIDAFYGDIDAFYGDIDAFYGDIDAFYGDIDAFYGDIDAFFGGVFANYGDIDAFYGDIDAFYGDIDAFYGQLTVNYGDIDAFYGDIDAFYGDIDAFYGDIDAFIGNLAPFLGVLHGYYGDIDAFYGDIDAFYGDIDAFFGGMETFFKVTANYGDIDAFYGDIAAHYGDIDAFFANVQAHYGDIDAFYGDIDAFYGDIDAFVGKLDPTYGDIDAFYGDIDAFGGKLDASYGDIDAFWGNLVSFYGDIDAFWGGLGGYSSANAADYEKVLQDLGIFFNMSADKFAVPVTLYTGTDFWQGFAEKVFSKYGIDPTDASSLALLDTVQRRMFFVDWFDGLMQFTGMDRVDHWMNAIHWSPRLTQDHEFNTEAVIGLLDFGVADQSLFLKDVVYSGGYEVDLDGTHGAGVVSLMVAPYDGRGIMGISPHASVAIYNPFDDTKTASFEDVETGIKALIANNARIINMSLGVPGTILTEDWSSILAGVAEDSSSEGTIFIKAAGNDGSVQTEDVDWESAAALNRLIIVGSTGVNGEITDWSNTPGTACAMIDGECDALMNHFMVAPGEFILVSDGNGGVTRQSGTSFSAPLVSGTAALIHGAWPWWKQHGEETVEVLLKSATDLGEEGVDEVYGWGMLNAEAALSPLDWDKLLFYPAKKENGNLKGGKSADWMRKTYQKYNTMKLEKSGAYVVGLEKVGETYRDFRVPLSTRLFDKTSDLDGHAREKRFQRHLYQRFADWANGGASFGDMQGFTARLNDRGDWKMSMVARPYTPGTDVREGQLPFQTDIRMRQQETGAEMRMGFGEGAANLTASKVFGFQSDFDAQTGGVNPLLGLASGGTYASTILPVSERLSVSASITETSHDQTFIDPITNLRVDGGLGLADYSAQAASVGMAYQLTSNIRLNLDYTQLQERDSLLGDQGTGMFALEGGSVTDAVTIGAETGLPFGMTLASSATLGKTRAVQFDSGFLSVGDDGLQTSAFAIGLHKSGIFGSEDQARISVSQPIQVENGALNFTALEIVDRNTGELGEMSQVWAVDGGARTLNFEAIYATPVFNGMGDVTAFTRTGSAISDRRLTDETEIAFGARLNIRF